jgi:hypothetical protein
MPEPSSWARGKRRSSVRIPRPWPRELSGAIAYTDDGNKWQQGHVDAAPSNNRLGTLPPSKERAFLHCSLSRKRRANSPNEASVSGMAKTKGWRRTADTAAMLSRSAIASAAWVITSKKNRSVVECCGQAIERLQYV